MDHESALLAMVVIEKKYTEVIDAGVKDDLFVGFKTEWEYVSEFHRKHGATPPPEEFEKMFPNFEMELVDAPSSFLVEALQKRYIHNHLTSGLQEAAKMLKAKDPLAAKEILQQKILAIDAAATPSLDVDMTQNPAVRIGVYKDLVAAGGITGYRTPWPVLDEVTLGFHPEELIMIVASSGVGKCVEASSKIVDPITGIERTIQEVVEGDQAEVLTWDEKSGITISKLEAKVDTGFKQCSTYVTESGREITVTPEHPFLTPRGWIPAEELDEGDYIGLPEVIPEPLTPVSRNLEETKFLALLLSEGSYTGHHVSFSTPDSRMVSIAEKWAEGTKAKIVYRSGYDYTITVGSVGGHTPNPARELLRSLGIDNTKSIHKTIPDEVFSLPNDELKLFLSVFWMADGYVEKRGAPGITLASQRMVEQIQHLLLRFGIQSSLRYKPVKGGFHAWRLRVYTHCIQAFSSHIPMWGEKGDRIQRRLSSGVSFNPNVGGPRVNSPKGYNWDAPGVHWDRIRSVDECEGPSKIYDLTVSDTHCFIANDIIVHNTWTEVILALHSWSLGHIPLLFTNEMSVDQIIRRADATNAQLPYQRFRAGELTQDEFERWEKSLNEMQKGKPPFWVSGDDDGAKGISGVEAKIIRYKPNIVFIDGVALMQDEQGAGSGWERLHNLSRGLKKIARRQRVPIVVSHWFSKDGKGNEGTADDLKFGDVQNHYDLILGLYQSDDARVAKEMLFRILKQREGERLEFVSTWDLDKMVFSVKELEAPSDEDDGENDTVQF